MYEPAPPHEIEFGIVSIGVVRPITHTDLGPLLDDLNERFSSVRSSRWSLEPPAAGELEIVFHLSIAVAATGVGGFTFAFVKKFAELLAEDTYKAIREKIASLRRRAGERNPHRDWHTALSIGSHHFYWRGTFTEEELAQRLLAAQLILDASPDYLIEDPDAAPNEMESGWYWNEREGRWVGSPGMERAMPPDWRDRS